MGVAPILVVDDESDMRTALLHALNRSGFRVESAASGSEAVAKCKKNTYSLVVTDVKMPEMNGMELLTAVRELSSQMPVIMITAFGTINSAVEAMQQGASDYILKPFSFETLETAVKKVIGTTHANANETASGRTPAGRSTPKPIISEDARVADLLKVAQNVACSHATVLIQGESGTGKELLARFIHHHSHQKKGSFVAVNCAALPEHLAESELFGHEKGAFTGALNRKIGKFELAKQGTIVLDEISEMAPPLQAKLLRVLQEREIDRVGGSRPIPIDARVIAISNVDLKQAISSGKFREDLYYRINVIPLTMPPLRERKSDIALLADFFLDKYSTLNNRKMPQLSSAARALLFNYQWKGNVRELENSIERAVLMGNSHVVLPEHLILGEPECAAQPAAAAAKVGTTVREMEKQLIVQTLREVDENRTRAAELLGISIRTLRNKLREYKAGEAKPALAPESA